MKLKKHMEQEYNRVNKMRRKAYKENNLELMNYFLGIQTALEWVMESKDSYLTEENWEQYINGC